MKGNAAQTSASVDVKHTPTPSFQLERGRGSVEGIEETIGLKCRESELEELKRRIQGYSITATPHELLCS